ncbi:hypothetical protein Vafri_20206, partial [Volvox africanus]
MALDGLGEKLKSLFKPKEDPRFKGQGRRLGTAEGHSNSSSNPQQPQHGANGVLAARRPAAFDTGAAPPETHTPLKPPPQPQGPGGRPALVLSRSHRTEDVVLDAAVMANTPTGKEANLVAAHKPPSGISSNLGPVLPSPSHPASLPDAASPYGPTTAGGGGGGVRVGTQGLEVDVQRSSGGDRGRHSANGSGGGGQPLAAPGRGKTQSRAATSNLSSMVSTISTPTAAEKRMGGFRCPAPPTDGAMADYGLAPATSQAYELQRCLALVLSSQPLSNSNLSTVSSASAMAAVMVAGTSMPPLAPPLQTPALVTSTAGAAAAPCRSASFTEAAKVSAAPFDETVQASLNPMASSSLSAKSLTPSLTSSEVAAGDGAAAVVAAPAGASGPSGAGAGAAAVATCTSNNIPQGTAGPRECCDALLRVLRNVMTKPEEDKFRQIRLSNPRVQETIVRVPGAVEFLEAAGFQMHFSPDDGSETGNHGYLVLPDEINPTALAEPFRILSAVMAAHGFAAAPPKPALVAAASPGQPSKAPAFQQKQSAASAGTAGATSPTTATASSPATSSAIERCTQVLLPAAPDTKVPDWFFERTGAEIREQWAAIIRKREEQERFMTRTMREVRMQQEIAAAAVAAGGAMTGGDTHAPVATVRVRFPEGVCLQGQFGASEPVSRVFEWVSGSLRSPDLTFELIKPDRRPLETSAAATADKGAGKGATPARASAPRPGRLLAVRDADMMPSILLNLRPIG